MGQHTNLGADAWPVSPDGHVRLPTKFNSGQRISGTLGGEGGCAGLKSSYRQIVVQQFIFPLVNHRYKATKASIAVPAAADNAFAGRTTYRAGQRPRRRGRSKSCGNLAQGWGQWRNHRSGEDSGGVFALRHASWCRSDSRGRRG